MVIMEKLIPPGRFRKLQNWNDCAFIWAEVTPRALSFALLTSFHYPSFFLYVSEKILHLYFSLSCVSFHHPYIVIFISFHSLFLVLSVRHSPNLSTDRAYRISHPRPDVHNQCPSPASVGFPPSSMPHILHRDRLYGLPEMFTRCRNTEQ
jgi:hypothetical protein